MTVDPRPILKVYKAPKDKPSRTDGKRKMSNPNELVPVIHISLKKSLMNIRKWSQRDLVFQSAIYRNMPFVFLF